MSAQERTADGRRVFHGTGSALATPSDLYQPPPWGRFRGGPPGPVRSAVPEAACRRVGRCCVTVCLREDDVAVADASPLLRRPLVITGPPGVGKSTLAYLISRELGLGGPRRLLEWNIVSRAVPRDLLYAHDAMGRAQAIVAWLSGASHPSAVPESAERNSERATMLRGVPEQDPARWREVADAVWLAAHRDRHAGFGRAPERPGQDGLRPPVDTPLPANRRDIEDVWRPDALPSPEPLAPTRRSRPGVGRSGEPAGESRALPDAQGDLTLHVGRELLPDGGRPHGLGWATALFARPAPTCAPYPPPRDSLELDEETTAEQGVVDGMWMTFLRPARTAASDLVLLTDDAPTMQIWEGITARLAGPWRASPTPPNCRMAGAAPDLPRRHRRTRPWPGRHRRRTAFPRPRHSLRPSARHPTGRHAP